MPIRKYDTRKRIGASIYCMIEPHKRPSVDYRGSRVIQVLATETGYEIETRTAFYYVGLTAQLKINPPIL